jgi:hypothetical protein
MSTSGSIRAVWMRCHRFLNWETAVGLAGVVALLLWCAVWASSIQHHRLRGGQWTWFPGFQYLGVDFLSCYQAARHWLDGGNPYREPFGDPLDRPVCYPPVILPLYAWTYWFRPYRAIVLGIAGLASLAGMGAWVSWRTRQRLGLQRVPLAFALASVLCSTPVLFALERGNWDLLVLPCLIFSAWALQRRSPGADIAMGLVLALAAWIKLYPGLLVLALVIFRRPRSLISFAVASLVIGVFCLRDLPQVYENIKLVTAVNTPAGINVASHSLSNSWQYFWIDTRFAALARIPGTLVAVLFVTSLLAWVGHGVYRCPQGTRLAYPFLLLLATTATLLPWAANDYNFFYLPLAALAVWDRRDPVAVHVLMGFLLLWWQPILLPIGPSLVFVFKLCGVGATSVSLVARARELSAAARNAETPQPLVSALQQAA